MNPFKQGDFLIDANTTPEMLQAKRDRLAALMPQYGKAEYIGEGLGQLFNGIGTGRQNKAMDAFQGERSAEAAQQFAAATGGPMSILGMRQQDQPTAGMGQPAQPTISTSGQPALGGAFDIAAKQIGLNERDQKAALSDYLQTGGQSLDPATTAWCAAFVNATLKQSGTEGTGKLNARSYMDWGQAVDKPQRGDVAVFSRGDPNGWQGHVGFFDSYNPDGTIKVLGGNQGDSVSLANYSPENLLGFRRAAEGGAPTQGQPMQGGQDMDALLQAQANPWLTQSQRAVLDGMISQRQSQQAAAEERYWRQNDPAYQQGLIKGQLEIDAMRNPAPPKGTDDMREYQFAQSQGYQGTFQDFMMGMKKAGATSVTVGGEGAPGLGKLSTDFGYVLDPATGQPKIDPSTGLPTSAPIPGSPAALEAEKAKAAADRRTVAKSTDADVIISAAQRAREAAGSRNFGAFGSGIIGAINPQSDSGEVIRQVNTLKSNGTFSALQQMRDNSPTGGALGAASDRDLQLLAEKAGALDPQSANFARDLDDYERTLLRTLYGKEQGDVVFEQSRAGSGNTGAPDADGWVTMPNGAKVRVKQ